MENAKIKFEIRINEGPKKGETVIVDADMEDLEEENLSDILVDRGDLEGWSNNDEYTVLSRKIIITHDN